MHMARKIRTTVVVTAAAEAVLQKYRNNLGLKGPLSVGLLLFDRLEPGEQLERIRRAEEADHDPGDLLALLRHLVAQVPEAALADLTPPEGEALRRYRHAVAAENAARTDEAAAAAAARRAPAKRRRSPGR
jgi:hypothetical protein